MTQDLSDRPSDPMTILASTGRRVATHPLDALDAEEIRLASAAVLESCEDLQRPSFALVALLDPPKDEVVRFRPGDRFARRAHVGVVDRATGVTHELVVRLPGAGAREASVESRRRAEGIQPAIVLEDFMGAAEAVLADERFVAALRRRGIEDLSQVHVDPLSPGAFPQNPQGHRIVWATPYLRPTPESNPYAKPIEHLRAAVDLNSRAVLRVIDEDPIVPLPDVDGRYGDEASVDGWRDDIKPLVVSQPEGPSFTLEGHELAWQRWKLHVALHPVDGLVLSHVRYEDDGGERQVVYRANLSEMVVPYGDTHDGFYWRTFFDAGEYGLGRNTNSLTLGCDCVGAVTYMDATMVDAAGRPRIIPNAICLHEEDAGVLWKHTDLVTGQVDVRRSRRLVISHFATVGNYDYGFYWSLYQDGTIELEVKLTGIVLTRAVTPDQELVHSTRVAPDLAAPHHQHLFNVRLDMAVDGFGNTVQEVDVVASDAGPGNPWGQAIETRTTTIEREAQGMRSIDPAAARTWRIMNRGRRNHVGEPVAYKLMPFNGPTLLASPASPLAARAGFARAHVWVTRYAPGELHAGGDYPNQHPGGAGLPEWIAQDRELVDTDVVVWHTFGVSHAVRTEDWPIMPVERIGFALRPAGFFARNPAVDVPPTAPECESHAGQM